MLDAYALLLVGDLLEYSKSSSFLSYYELWVPPVISSHLTGKPSRNYIGGFYLKKQ